MNATVSIPKTTDVTLRKTAHEDVTATNFGTSPSVPPTVTPPPSGMPRKPLRRWQFIAGLLLAFALMLVMAIGILQESGLSRIFSMPLVAIAAIASVMMLGGGFVPMATAAAGLDDGEFDRLLEASEAKAAASRRSYTYTAVQSEPVVQEDWDSVVKLAPVEDSDSRNTEQRTNQPERSSREQRNSGEIQEDAESGHLSGGYPA